MKIHSDCPQSLSCTVSKSESVSIKGRCLESGMCRGRYKHQAYLYPDHPQCELKTEKNNFVKKNTTTSSSLSSSSNSPEARGFWDWLLIISELGLTSAT